MSIGRVIKKCTVCGEVYTIEKKFKSSPEAYNWEQSMSGIEGGMCKKCYRNKKNAENVAAVEAYNLVELTGSEKQIAWANNIRAELVAKALESKPKKKFFDLVNEKTDAKWWIDHRHISATYNLVVELQK